MSWSSGGGLCGGVGLVVADHCVEDVTALLTDVAKFVPDGQDELAATLESGRTPGTEGQRARVHLASQPGAAGEASRSRRHRRTRRPRPNRRTVAELLACDQVARVSVPDDFTDADPETLQEATMADPRMQFAADTAADPGRLTQVLAGGTRLLARLHPEHPGAAAAFPPTVTAVITAVGDLVRVGHPNRIPHQLLKAAAVRYLTDDRYRCPDWIQNAVDYASQDARADLNCTTTCCRTTSPVSSAPPRSSPYGTALPPGVSTWIRTLSTGSRGTLRRGDCSALRRSYTSSSPRLATSVRRIGWPPCWPGGRMWRG